MLKLMNKAVVVKALKTGAVVGVGMASAKIGGYALRRGVDAINTFAMESDNNAAVVDAAGGLVLSGGVLMVIAKVKGAGLAGAVAPFLIGGVIVATALPRAIDYVASKVTEALDKALPVGGGSFVELPRLARASSGRLLAEAGGFLASQDNGMSLGGEMRRAGGLMADPSTLRGGELRRAGGLFADGRLGGELRRF